VRRTLRFHPAAVTEAEAAADWYAKRSGRAAANFVSDLSASLEKISERPGQFPPGPFGTRRLAMRRYPYQVIFRESGAELQIIAIAHGRRRPEYWRSRTP